MIVRGLLPAYRRYVPEKKILSLLISVVDKIPPLSKSDEGFLFVRLPVLSVALQSLEANDLEKIYAKACEADESTKSILDGLSEFILSDKNLPSTKAAAGTCVYALGKSGINCNLECPVVPQASKAFEAIVNAVASDDLGGVKNGINYMSLLVRMCREFFDRCIGEFVVVLTSLSLFPFFHSIGYCSCTSRLLFVIYCSCHSNISYRCSLRPIRFVSFVVFTAQFDT